MPPHLPLGEFWVQALMTGSTSDIRIVADRLSAVYMALVG